jgi:hypothetical protein
MYVLTWVGSCEDNQIVVKITKDKNDSP